METLLPGVLWILALQVGMRYLTLAKLHPHALAAADETLGFHRTRENGTAKSLCVSLCCPHTFQCSKAAYVSTALLNTSYGPHRDIAVGR